MTKIGVSIIAFAALISMPDAAHAYVDPGLVSMAIQGLFAAVAGFAAVYVIGPWRWIKSLFKRSEPSTQTQGDVAPKGKID